jgi:formylglycine-generating enzyme required for sulfatase activity
MTNRITFLTDETNHRVRRGGSWLFDPQYARVAFRNYRTPVYRDYRDDLLGVRLVEVIEEVNV